MKKFLVGILVFMMLFSLVGCNDKNDSESTMDVNENGKITIWAWDPNFNIAIMEEAKARFEKEYPNVEIEIVDYAKADLEQKLHTNLASGTTNGLPDIVLIEDYNAQMYLQSYPGSFADLTGQIDHKDFVDYKTELMTLDGKVYGVPFDSGVAGFYYRTDILEAAGYSASDLADITWDDFIKIAQDVKDKTGTAMLAFDPNDGGLMRIMMQSAGAWYFDEEGNPNLANNPALEDAVRVYKEIAGSNFIKPTSGWGEWVGAFNSGDTASVITGVWITGSVKAEASQSGLWAVAPVPRLNVANSKNASNLGGSSWYVLNSSKEKGTAIEFLKTTYAKDVDFYQNILVDRGAVGSYIPSQSGSAYVAEDPFFNGQKVYADFSKWMSEIPAINYGTYTYEADAAIFGQMGEVYSGGNIKDALKKAEDQLKSQIQ
ncbi:MAG: extracellular solute-binding protein [Clostridia bacterium]|nr:extracellular solute-binding protein [Clostridia bacterium]